MNLHSQVCIHKEWRTIGLTFVSMFNTYSVSSEYNPVNMSSPMAVILLELI